MAANDPVAGGPKVNVVSVAGAAAGQAPKVSGGTSGIVVPVKPPPFRIGGIEPVGHWFKALIYGKYGIGKTYLAGTVGDVPEMGDVLWIDAEAGTLTLQGLPWTDKLDRVECTNMATLARVHEFLQAHVVSRDANNEDHLRTMEAQLKGVTPADITTPKKYRTVVIDSFSEIDRMHMSGLLGITDKTALDAEIEKAEWEHYGKNLSKMILMARIFRNLKMHVIFLCAEAFTEDEIKRKKFLPAMTGQARSVIQGIFDVVGYLTSEEVTNQQKNIRETERRLYIVPGPRWDAKNRFSNVQAGYFANPTIKQIVRAIGIVKEQPSA